MIPPAMDFMPYRRRRIVPPPEPPLEVLLAESRERERTGHLAELALLREEARHHRAPAGLAGPEGPDPVVFGSVPRVGAG